MDLKDQLKNLFPYASEDDFGVHNIDEPEKNIELKEKEEVIGRNDTIQSDRKLFILISVIVIVALLFIFIV